MVRESAPRMTPLEKVMAMLGGERWVCQWRLVFVVVGGEEGRGAPYIEVPRLERGRGRLVEQGEGGGVGVRN